MGLISIHGETLDLSQFKSKKMNVEFQKLFE